MISSVGITIGGIGSSIDRSKLVVVVAPISSDTSIVIVVAPVCPISGITVIVVLSTVPAIEILELCSNVRLEEVAEIVKLDVSDSVSLIVKLKGPIVSVPGHSVTLDIFEIVGFVLAGPKFAIIFFEASIVTSKGFVDPEASPDQPIKRSVPFAVAFKVTKELIE